MPDPRYYAKLDVGYFDNPKTTDLVETRPQALIFHLRAILYCRQHLTDGQFPVRLVARLACGSHCGSQCEGQCDVCASRIAGLVDRIDDRTYEVHDYLKHQDSGSDVARRKAAGQKAAAKRWDADGNADRNAKGNANRNADSNAEERRGEERTNTRPHDAQFEEFWETYPKKVGKGQAAKAYRAALKKTDSDIVLAGLRSHLPIWVTTERQFIPNPATWLNGERWSDDVASIRAPIGRVAGDRRPEGW